jgi:adenosylcobinamide-GDP ribazoletransferase
MNPVADLRCGIAFCTRLPVGAVAADAGALAGAAWTLPLAGALVGAVAAAVYAAAAALGLAGPPGAALALAASLALTGCLHEDGLGDTADGFGGGRDRDAKLGIMRDSRLGTYGAAALILSLLLRWSALAVLMTPAAVALALVAAHTAARGALPALMHVVPMARRDGLAAAAGRPPAGAAAVAGGLGALALVLALGPLAGAAALALVAATAAFTGRLAVRQIGGLTGDVLGAAEQAGEIAVLLVAAAAQRTAL